MDDLFRAIADRSRRRLLDLLRERNGQSLAQLCEHLDMSRQAVSKHLGLLQACNLVVTLRRGRNKLHYLNALPLQEICERWIGKFERHHLQALAEHRKGLEEL
jgi:DNA-binding transcriptional ArsR family regulator